LKEKLLCENAVISILDCVECFKYKLTRACEIEQANLKQNKVKMKQLYDKDAMIRKFKLGENVIVLLLIRCHPLQLKTLHTIKNTNKSIFTKPFFFQKRPPTECPTTSSKGLQRRDS
jgi:hypothetical protein